MKTHPHLFILIALLLPLVGSGQTTYIFQKKTGATTTEVEVTPQNSKAFGLDGSGNLSMLSVSGASTLAGLTDVALTDLAGGHLLQYNSGTSKWSNVTLQGVIGDRLHAFYSLEDATGVLTNDGAGVFSYTRTSTGGNGMMDEGKIVEYGVSGRLAASGVLQLLSLLGEQAQLNILSPSNAVGATIQYNGTTNNPVYLLADVAGTHTLLSTTAANAAYQPLDSELTAISSLVSAADALPYFTGSGSAALTTLTAAARSVLDDASVTAMRSTLGAYGHSSSYPYFIGGLTVEQFDNTGVDFQLLSTADAVRRHATLDTSTLTEEWYGNGTNVPLVLQWPAISGADTYVLAAASQTITNKTLSGASNSLTNLNASNISSGELSLARIGQNGATSGQALAWNGTAWAPATIAGASPGGSGSELQYRSGASTLGAVSGSSVSGGAVTLGGVLTLPNGSAAAPSLTVGDATTGFYRTAADRVGIATAGAIRLDVGVVSGSGTCALYTSSGSSQYLGLGGSNVAQLGSSSNAASLCGYWNVSTVTGGISSTNRAYPIALGGDVQIVGDAADIFAHRRSTNAQEVRVYNTDNGANDEYFTVDWKTAANECRIGTMKTGTGTARALKLVTDGVVRMTVKADGTINMTLPTSSAGLASGDLWNDSGTVKIVP